MNQMGFLSTQSDRPSRLRDMCSRSAPGAGALRKGLALATIAILGGLALGCSDNIEGVPSCDAKMLVVTGESTGRTITINSTFTGGLTQDSSGGTMALMLDSQAPFTLTWDTELQDGAATTVTGSIDGVPGGPLCYGGDSQVEVTSDAVTFHLQALHACDASSFVLGEIFGCAGLTGN